MHRHRSATHLLLYKLLTLLRGGKGPAAGQALVPGGGVLLELCGQLSKVLELQGGKQGRRGGEGRTRQACMGGTAVRPARDGCRWCVVRA